MVIFKISVKKKHLFTKITIFSIILLAFLPISFGAISPTAVLFGATRGDIASLYTIDPTNGETAPIGSSVGFFVTGLAFSPDGTLYGAHDDFTRIDRATGAGTLIGPTGTICADLSFAPDGTLYCITPRDRPYTLYTINLSTGAGTLVGATGLRANALGSAIGVSPTGTIFFGNSDGLYTLSPTTGNATLVAPWTFPDVINGQSFCRPSGFDFDPSGRLFASFICVGSTFLVTVDTGTATVALVGQTTVNNLGAIAFDGKALPLAGTILDACTRGPLEGATVTLLKESPPGSNTFVLSPPADHIPLTNPESTGADGTYGWSVVSGTYKIMAEKTDYSTGESTALAIPPAVTGVSLSLSRTGECPPILAPIPSMTIDELTTLTFTASATDPNVPPRNLTFSLVGAPAGATINPATGLFTWTPTEAQGPANYTFDIHVTDGLFDVFTTVHVTVNEVNSPPSIDPEPDKTVPALTTLTFTATATDPDIPVQNLTFSLVGAPAGATINPATGVFTWTPTEAQGPGNYTFEVHVTDGFLDVSTPVFITVSSAVNLATKGDAEGNGEIVNKGIKFGFDVKSNDGVKFHGKMQYNDKDMDIKIRSEEITFLSVNANGTQAMFGGIAKIDKETGFTFTLDVEENGKGSKDDFFSIIIKDPAGNIFYTKEGYLKAGNIHIHK